jgi:diaminohydroxyphosphoribosylaminopyrimidine deaminase/5-amino-6-(5-phosphoribosylamino)uracil reductase
MTSNLAEAPAASILGAAGAEVIRLEAAAMPRFELDLQAVLHALAKKGITRLLVEGGARVASSFVSAGLVDEFWLLRGPDNIGGDGVAALEGLPLTSLTQSPGLRIRASENLDQDILTVYERV